MNIHEHQAKELLRSLGVDVLDGRVAFTPEEAARAYAELKSPVAVVKSQIHAGGRGKGKAVEPSRLDPSKYDAKTGVYSGPGIACEKGVVLCKSAAEVEATAKKLLGKVLVTKQTGAQGRKVQRLYVEAGCPPEQEFYAAVLLDRAVGLPLLMISPAGGMDIEEVAEKHPGQILKQHFDPDQGLWPFQARRAAYFLGLKGDAFKSGVKVLTALARAAVKLDVAMLEINPLARSGERVFCMDAKLSYDDNALFRQKQAAEQRDLAEEDSKETEAKKYDLSYIALDGNIGCLVNGAGLAMATMDAIKLFGGEPANFLDVGGGANKEKVAAGFKIILQDPEVKAILVNIFGGIMRCDVIAEGVIAAVKEVNLKVPLVVRLEGNQVERGKQLLKDSGLPIQTASTLSDAAEKVCATLKK
ncbi:MAG: ADP-forming succinate--CoA ligase subunit beta [Planctomycetota bacterium]|nr:ADP-forming succinate--CoA ligase subunit beta [Planctomycetota bacterium]